jgi:hypothetical protein
MKSVAVLLKKRSTRHVSEITAIASEFCTSAKKIVPSSWLGVGSISTTANIRFGL